MYRKSPKRDKGSQCVKMGFLWGWGGGGVGWIFSLKSGLKILIWAPKNSQNDQFRAASGGIKIPRRLFNENTLKPKTLDLENVG